jgi:hypothetical protein
MWGQRFCAAAALSGGEMYASFRAGQKPGGRLKA